MEFISNAYFIIPFTLAIYGISRVIYEKTKLFIFTPILITVASTIALIHYSDLTYESYKLNTVAISFWLKPSVVALAIPLYQNLDKVIANWRRLLMSVLVGSLSGIVSVVTISSWMGASELVVRSLAAKSVTTPIAIQITDGIGGDVAITAGVVALVGVFGAIIGESFLKMLRIKGVRAIGLATGSAAHGIGVAKITSKGDECSAFGAIGIVLNGVFTAVLTPIILPILLQWL